MPVIKLMYFKSRGRAELSRLILAQAGVEYEDARYEREDWLKIKPTIPFGQMPAMEYDGTILFQSNAIARFLAREYNLNGKTNLEMAQADAFIDCIEDMTSKVIPIYYEKDDSKKPEMKEKFNKDTLAPFVENILIALKKNGGKYLVGSDVTIADLAVANILFSLIGFVGDWKPAHPEMEKYMNEILALPNIKAWIAKRPETEH